jgi:thienamycin biosynthesis protein ThnN
VTDILSTPSTLARSDARPPERSRVHALTLHFDPHRGSPYWIERAHALGVRAGDLQSLDDLAVFGPMDEEALRTRPLDDFIPRQVRESGTRLIPSETGGATGAPKLVVFTLEEFEAGFVTPFISVAAHTGFPRGGRWLFVGPTGPHIIGRAARHLARALGADDPFTVDFDPRWHRRLVPGSLVQRRHLEHVITQALHVLERVEIQVLFITPSTLHALLPQMTERQRLAVRGAHYGGQPVTAEDLADFRDALPNAVHLGGYGNSLVGVCMQVPGEGDATMAHHAAPPRHVIRLLQDPTASLTREVEIGARGRVMFHRLDDSFLLLNMVERDEATRLPPSPLAARLGLTAEGIGDPMPCTAAAALAAGGIY